MSLSLAFGKLWLQWVGSAALLVGMKQRAREAYEQIVALDPSDVAARATVGNMAMESGDREGAKQVFRKLLDVAPDDSNAWFNLGYIHDQCDEVEAAEQAFRRSVELNPDQDRAWYGLALVLIRQDRLHDAIAPLRRNIKLQPFSPYGYYQLAMTLHHLGDSGEVWRTYEQLKNFEPRYAATLKRDIEQTRSRAAGTEQSVNPNHPSTEALPATT